MYAQVLSSVRKAVNVTNFSLFSRKSDTFDSVDESDTNLYRREISRAAILLGDDGATYEVRAAAAKHIGHHAFTGAPEADKAAAETILLLVKTKDSAPLFYRLQVVKTLAEICYSNKAHQDKVRVMGGLDMLLRFGDNILCPSLRQWSFYAISVIVAGNVFGLQYLLDTMGAKEVIGSAANDPTLWLTCENFADLLLQLLGLKLLRSNRKESIRQEDNQRFNTLRACV